MVVEDDRDVREVLVELLRAPGREVVAVGSAGEARKHIKGTAAPAVAVLDLGLPDETGLVLIREMVEADPACVIVILTGRIDEATVVEAMRLGAAEYVTKPFDGVALQRLVEGSIERYLETRRTLGVRRAKGAGEKNSDAGFLVGRSAAMVELFKMIGKLAASDVPVLIRGESGTGKELVARALHGYGDDSRGRFVPVDCAGIPATLLESELFGYERGAFTDARESKPGRFEMADGGTLFLDEIGNIPMEVQAKLLRALQDRATQRLGSNRLVSWKTRIVSATNSDLKELVRKKGFREDLLFRIAGAELVIPPLRERVEDIPLLVDYFLERRTGNDGKPRISPEALRLLERYAWPGNVRELEHAVERAVAMSRGPVIGSGDLPEEIRSAVPATGGGQFPRPGSVEEIVDMDEMKRRYARECLELCGGDRKEAARRMQVHVKTLNALLREGLS